MPNISGEFLYNPKAKNDLMSLADRVEIRCLDEKKISMQDILSEIGMLEECESDGEEAELEGFIGDLINEIDKRKKLCSGNYPFSATGSSVTLSCVDSTVHEFYKFLLYVSNGNMRENCSNNNVNATLLFEELSEITVKNYLGERAKTYLFGTVNKDRKQFPQRIEDLIQKMNEGKGFKDQPQENYCFAKDDGLDVAAWIPFSDGCPGQLIAFGQCKTGTSWNNTHLETLHPDSFCKRWFKEPPVHTPIRLFFLSEGLDRRNWYNTSTRGGIIFDRFRIMALLNNSLVGEVHKKVTKWLMGWIVK